MQNKINNKKILAFSLIAILAFAAYGISEIPFIKNLGISSLIIAVCIGALIGNFNRSNAVLLKRTGVIGFSTKQILRLGIILYGFKITLKDIEHVGLSGIFIAFCIVFSTFFIGLLIGKLLKIDLKQSMLISSGSSICGAAAILASQGTIKGNSNSVAIAVCTVVVFGTLGMFLYPLAYHFGIFNLSEEQIGYLIGSSLHEVAHVVASSSSITIEAKNNAIILKMMRVLMLVPFLLLLSFLYFRIFTSSNSAKFNLKNSFPYFALYFLIATGISSIPLLNNEFSLTYVKPLIDSIDTILLSMSMIGLGVGIHKNVLKNAGLAPFIMSAILCVWLVAISYVLIICLT